MNHLSTIFFRALHRAICAHDKQWRKGDPNLAPPYVVHCVQVAEMLATHGQITAPDTLAIALLHDTLEDTSLTYADLEKEFNSRIANGVLELTIPAHIQKGTDCSAQKHLFQMNSLSSMSVEAQLVKYVDKTCNVQDLVTLPPSWGRKAILGYAQKAKEVCDRIATQIKLPQSLQVWHTTVFHQFAENYEVV